MVDLLCVPGAGAGASRYQGWAGALPAFTSLLAGQLPGRENRIYEPFATSLADCADHLTESYLMRRVQPRPLVLCGHSMGGALAFEIAIRLAAAGRMPRAIMFLASSPARGSPGQTSTEPLIDLLLRYDAANADLVNEPELFEALSQRIGADIAMLREHSSTDDKLLEPEVHILAGEDDPVVPLESARRWIEYCPNVAICETLPGGHTFPFGQQATLVPEILNALLTRIARTRAPFDVK